MIKLFSVKQKQKEDAQNNNGRPIKKQSAGELRVQKGLGSRFPSIPFQFCCECQELVGFCSFVGDLGFATLPGAFPRPFVLWN